MTNAQINENIIIRNTNNLDWGTFRVLRKYDKGIWEIRGEAGDRVLFESELYEWEVV